MNMGEASVTRSNKEYEIAQKIIKVLIDNGLIRGESEINTYMKDWNMVFEILDLTKEG